MGHAKAIMKDIVVGYGYKRRETLEGEA